MRGWVVRWEVEWMVSFERDRLFVKEDRLRALSFNVWKVGRGERCYFMVVVMKKAGGGEVGFREGA